MPQPSYWLFAIDFHPASLVQRAACSWTSGPNGVSTLTPSEPPTTRPLPEIAPRKPEPPKYVVPAVLSQTQNGDWNVPYTPASFWPLSDTSDTSTYGMCVKVGARAIPLTAIWIWRTSPPTSLIGVDTQASSTVASPDSPEFQYSSGPSRIALGVL